MGHPTIENRTPFAFDFTSLMDEEGRSLLLLLVKATYQIGRTRLEPSDQQVPVNWAGVSWGTPGESSDKYEPECAFIKLATDVVLIGHAHAPRRGITELLVALQVGPLKKVVRVVGERTWFKSLGRISMTKPLPFERMPLTWERAFGGWDRTAREPKKHTFEPCNPVGVGFRASPGNFEEGLRLPNLEDPEHPLREFGQRVPPTGVGFTSPHWQPRAAFAGTCDEEWERTRKPRLPADFDRRFFNAAPPGLITPGYLQGNEPVTLLNTSPRGRLDFSLPNQPPPRITVLTAGGADLVPTPHLDTLILDTNTHQVLLLWRSTVPLYGGVREVRAVVLEPSTDI